MIFHVYYQSRYEEWEGNAFVSAKNKAEAKKVMRDAKWPEELKGLAVEKMKDENAMAEVVGEGYFADERKTIMHDLESFGYHIFDEGT